MEVSAEVDKFRRNDDDDDDNTVRW